MQAGGSLWHPPRLGEAAAGGAGGGQEERSLTEAERSALEGVLQGLTVERASVQAAMVFAMDLADAAREVSQALVESLLVADAPPSTRVARLFLLSDLLHNSRSQGRNAAAFRTHLVAALPAVFEGLHAAHGELESRISAQALRRHVSAVLRAWADWFLFTELFLSGLEHAFLRSFAPVPGLPQDAALRAQLEALSPEELQRRCRQSGLLPTGDGAHSVQRLLALDCFRRAARGEVVASRPEVLVPQLAPADPKAAERGGWTQLAAPGVEERGCKRSRSPSPVAAQAGNKTRR